MRSAPPRSRRGRRGRPTARPRPRRSPRRRRRTRRATTPRPRARAAASSASAARARRRGEARASAAAKASRAFTCAERSRLAGVRRALSLAALAVMIVAGASAAASPRDHALLALNILPPGQGANTPELTSQIAMYDGLTPLQGNVTARRPDEASTSRETLGLGGAKATHVVKPKAGVTIYRDSFGVPHVYGKTRAEHRVRRRLGDGGGSRALPAAPARPGAHLGARRAGLRRVLGRALGAHVRPERADRGVPRERRRSSPRRRRAAASS